MGTTQSSSVPWMMVETLDPAVLPTVVSGGDGGRDFTTTHRVLERAITAAQLGTHVTADDLYRHIISSRDQGKPIELTVGEGENLYRFRALPVFGPNRRVHGVQYWLGPTHQKPPEPRRAAGVVWDLPTKMVHLTTDCTRMAGIPDAEFVPDLPLASFWRIASRFDDHEAVFNLLYHPRQQAKMQTTGTVRHANGHNMLWQATIRTRYDDDTAGAWGLLEDLTSEDSQPPTATLEQIGLREYLRSIGTYLGIIHIPDGTVVQWLSDPPPWIDCTRSTDQLLPPEDHARLTTAVAPDEGVVRVLNSDNGYTPTKIVLSPYRGCDNNRLALGQFLRADEPGIEQPSGRAGCRQAQARAPRRPPHRPDDSVVEQSPTAKPDVPTPLPTGRERLHTLAEVPKILRVSRTKVFELLASGALASIQIGSRRFVTDSQIDDYLAKLKSQH